ncbi:hypothetical protein HQ545_04935 [Candidatus Woesearchaeota archaeon]|nr:hypothetical protein [Candidatus Woesearchaeota archaeon]
MEFNKPKYEPNLEDKLSSTRSEEVKDIDSILDHDEFYKNCMYCGRIYGYGGNYDKVLYQNGVGPLKEEFNDYNISTGVGPCCYTTYQKQLDEVRRYNSTKTLK